MTQPKATLPPGAIALLAVVVAVVAVAAMFLADEDDLFDFSSQQTQYLRQGSEIRGQWLGMSVAPTDSPTALNWNIPPRTPGVVVADISSRDGRRASQAGIRQGDVITGVDGQRVQDISDFVDATNTLNVAQPILVDVQRAGLPMTLVVPALAGAQPGGTPYAATPVAPFGSVNQPAVMFQGPPPAYGPVAPAAAPMLPPLFGGTFVCPLHGLAFGAQQVHPHYRCPQCNTFLRRVR